ncbi:MAG: methionyl-tRNA formyltransferase [Bacilli bacterium]
MELKDLKVVFMGTPDFAVPILKMLIENTNVVMVVSQPDKLVGRKKVLTPTPVKELATNYGIEVYQPAKISDDINPIIRKKPDIIITCAYGQIVPKHLLMSPNYGCINVHASLLPEYRGGAPIHRCLMDGAEKTGVTIMYMDETLDTGNIINSKEYIIEDTDNVGTLHEKLSALGAELLLKTLPKIVDGTNFDIPQDNEMATYAYNIKREDEHINFNKTSKEIWNHVRALNPWPLSNTIIDDVEIKVLNCHIGEKISDLSPGTISVLNKKELGIQTIDGIIYLDRVKPFGKKEMDITDYINGLDKEKILNSIVK